ncbi:MAG TPA: M48 family metallopeptidase [Rudaea sp.]
MSAVAATFFDGRSSRAQAVQLSVAGDFVLTIRAADWERSESLASVRVTPRVAGIHRTLVLPDGSQLQVEDNDAVDAWFPDHNRGAAWVDRLERHSLAVAASLLVTVLGIVGVIFYGIPYAAEKIATHIPDSVAREMGQQTVTLLGRFGFDKSELPKKRRDELQAVFKKYVADLPDPAHYELHFLDAKMPNAFALPGGIIVVTDEMVRLVATAPANKSNAAVTNDADGGVTVHFKTQDAATKGSGNAEDENDSEDDEDGDDADDAGNVVDHAKADGKDDAATVDGKITKDESQGSDVVTDQAANERFLAVIAHEVGHEEHRHVLRSVLQNSAVVLASAYFTGDVSSASALVVSVPTFLLNNHYSRAFEEDADTYAFASLAAHHISPGRFAEVLELMQKADPHVRREAGYLSTHPLSVDRIMSARAAAARFGSNETR